MGEGKGRATPLALCRSRSRRQNPARGLDFRGRGRASQALWAPAGAPPSRQGNRPRPSGVIYDVTNTYLYGSHCPLAKLGHDKEQVKGRPLIQIALAVTQKEGFPLFHKVFDGNVHDARTLQDSVTQFRGYHLRPGLFIYDRGIVSGRNVKDVKQLHWDTLCGMPLRENLKKFWRPFADLQQLLQLPYRQRVGQTVFYARRRPYQLDGVRGQLALCWNERLQRDLRESRRDEIRSEERRVG